MFQTETNTQLKHEEEFDGILRKISAQDNTLIEQNKVLDQEGKKLESLVQEKECKLIGLLKNTKKTQERIEARVSILVGKANLIRKQGHSLTKNEILLYEKTQKINTKNLEKTFNRIVDNIKHTKQKKLSTSAFSELKNYTPCDNNDQKEAVKNLSRQTQGLREMLEGIKEIKAWIEIMKDP